MPHIHDLIDFTVTGYIVHQDKVLLILHKKLNLWLPPGGHVELDEDPEEALYRELKEECGLDVEIVGSKPEQMSERTKMLYAPAFLDIHRIDEKHRHVGMHYVCRVASDRATMNAQELDEMRWFSLDEIEQSDVLMPEIKFYASEAIRKVS